jgi:dTDP-4-dehydrorhamnose 3,5-epimerase
MMKVVKKDLNDILFCGFGDSYVSIVKPGEVKGFYTHRYKECHITCVVGKVKFVIVDDLSSEGAFSVNEVYLGGFYPSFAVVPPGFWYGWSCLGDTASTLINVVTENNSVKDNDILSSVDAIKNPWNYKWEIKND